MSTPRLTDAEIEAMRALCDAAIPQWNTASSAARDQQFTIAARTALPRCLDEIDSNREVMREAADELTDACKMQCHLYEAEDKSDCERNLCSRLHMIARLRGETQAVTEELTDD